MDSKVTAYISNVKPFQVAVVAFVAMMLVSIGLLISSTIAITKTNRHVAVHPLKQAHTALNQGKQLNAEQVKHVAHFSNLHAITNKFLDGQYGVVTLSAIVLVLAFAGLVSASMVVNDVPQSGGTTDQDYMWLSSLGSIVLGQGILLMVIGIFTTVEYKAVRQPTIGLPKISAEQNTYSKYLMAELILGYVGLLGGIVFYASMRMQKK